jgi:hypothetical protein
MTNYISNIFDEYLNRNPDNLDSVTEFFLERDVKIFRRLFRQIPNYVSGENFIVARKYRGILEEFSLKKDETPGVAGELIKLHRKLVNVNQRLPDTPLQIMKALRKVDGLYFLNSLYGRVLENKIGYPFKISLSVVHRTGEYGQSDTELIKNQAELKRFIVDTYIKLFTVINSDGSIYDDDIPDGDSEDDTKPYYRILLNSMVVSIAKFKNRQVNGRKWDERFDKFVMLPKDYSDRVINPLNNDKYCFFYSLYLSQFYDKKQKKLSIYWSQNSDALKTLIEEKKDQFDEFYDENGKFIFSQKNIKKIEDLTGKNIHVYSLFNSNFICFFRSEFRNEGDVIRIMYIPYSSMIFTAAAGRSVKKREALREEFKIDSQVEIDNVKSHFDFLQENSDGHFVLIPNPVSFFNASGNTHGVCKYCDNVFVDTEKHEKICESFLKNNFSATERCTILTPNKKDEYLSFNHQFMKTKMGFVIYADTETIADEKGTHNMISYMLYAHCYFNSEFNKAIRYTATTPEEFNGIQNKFMHDLMELRIHCTQKSNLKRTMTYLEKLAFLENHEQDENCLFCGEDFDVILERATKKQKEGKNQISRKVLHHDHNSGEIIGYVCHGCNMNERKSHTISVCFHNLSFDLLVILKSFGEREFVYNQKTYEVEHSINLLAKSSQKYSTISLDTKLQGEKDDDRIYLYPLKFIDSYAFQKFSLDHIISMMVKGKNPREELPITYKYFSEKYDPEFFDACCYKKGALAYDKITLETLKNKENFTEEEYNSNSLGLSFDEYKGDDEFNVSIQNKSESVKNSRKKLYEQSEIVWNHLKRFEKEGMTMKHYFDYYLELDVYLLADFFEKLRKTCFDTHKLEIAYCQGLASYSQRSFLNYTKKKLYLIDDLNLCQLLIENMRGGFSGVMNKYSDNFENSEKKMIWYLDVNNLYGKAMTSKLANKYLGTYEYSPEIQKKMDENVKEKYAYFCLIDYQIPPEIHDKLSKLPPLISKKTIENKDVSSFNKGVKFCESGKDLVSAYKSTKLCATLENGENYLCDYNNLKFYKSLGYVIQIKQVFKFKCEYIMKDYIDLNTSLRQKSTDEIGKQFYKDLNNIIYGKSLENPLGYKNFEMFAGIYRKLDT